MLNIGPKFITVDEFDNYWMGKVDLGMWIYFEENMAVKTIVPHS